ncbi:hypothetical protein JCM33374_g6352 [Metschnikowia sp. JCM 33374]|nr:hypothetical protein JCM33374_g6352 [Metschnikowia sp. JCM 33374]
MSCPVYCILSGGNVHCVPVTAFNNTNEETLEKLTRSPPINSFSDGNNSLPPRSPVSIAIKKKNLLYTLNNPSLSDLESDVSRRLSTGSHTQDEEEHEFDSQYLRFSSQKAEQKENCPREGSPLNGNDSATDGIWVNSVPQIKFDGNGTQKKIINIGTDMADIDSDDGGIAMSILDDYSTHAVYLPQYSVDLQGNLDTNYTQIKGLLTKIFPSWSNEISIKQLTGGITNMLLSCSHLATEETLLMRVYGQGTNLIIDRNREFVSHLVLNSLKLAPSIHARFSNGLIYGFLPGRSLEPSELSNSYIYPLIAQQLGNWHNSINCEYIEDGVNTLRKYSASLKKRAEPKLFSKPKPGKGETKNSKSVNNIWDLIEDWIEIVPQNQTLATVFKENTVFADVTIDNIREIVMKEFDWLKQELKMATKSPVVVSHCDLLSGNIIVPSSEDFANTHDTGAVHLPSLEDNPIQFIDYEYMLPAPRAFDIANHFAEWQGFDCNRSAIPEPSPSNPVMVSWCKGYLNDENAPEDKVRGLIDEIACYYGMPGFYWGIWAMIQSELSTIDFNYAEYGKLRLEEYWLWKKQFVRSARSGNGNGGEV